MSSPRIVILGLVIVLLAVILFTRFGVNQDNEEIKVYEVPIARYDIPQPLEAVDNAVRLAKPTTVGPSTKSATESTEAEMQERLAVANERIANANERLANAETRIQRAEDRAKRTQTREEIYKASQQFTEWLVNDWAPRHKDLFNEAEFIASDDVTMEDIADLYPNQAELVRDLKNAMWELSSRIADLDEPVRKIVFRGFEKAKSWDTESVNQLRADVDARLQERGPP